MRLRVQRLRLRSQEGAAAVEFAILLPVLLLVMFGIIDLGRLLFLQVSLAAASHEGSRASSLHTVTSTNGSQVAQTVGAAVANAAPGAARLGSLSNTQMVVANPTYCSSGHSSTRITAQAPFRWIMPVGLVLPHDPDGSLVSQFTASATSEMLCVR